jgi:hypothetical protein
MALLATIPGRFDSKGVNSACLDRKCSSRYGTRDCRDGWRSPFFIAREGRIRELLFQIQLFALEQVTREPPQAAFHFPASHPMLESAVSGLW